MTHDETFVLNQFYSSTSKKENLVMAITLKEFIEQPEYRNRTMEHYATSLQAEHTDVAYAYLAGWLGSLTAAFMHLSLFHDQSMNINLDTIEMEFYPSNHHTSYFIHFRYEILDTSKHPTFSDFFGSTISPVLQTIEQASNIRLDYLWRLVIPGIFWAEKRWRKHDLFSSFTNQIQKTLDEISSLPASTFFVSRNPYQYSYVEVDNPWDETEKMWRKPACCMAYRTANHGYCYTCPRLKPEEREERFYTIKQRLKEKKQA